MNFTKLILSPLLFSSLISLGQESTLEETKSDLLKLKKENTELIVQKEKFKNETKKLKATLNVKENEITQLNNQVIKLDEEIKYYKKTLNLINSKIETKFKDVDFKINSVTGNSNTGKITVKGILINKGVLRSIQGKSSKIFDPQGNGINSFKVLVGNETRIDKLFKDVPTKFSVEIEQVIEGTPVIKILMIDFYSNIGYSSDNINIVFKNLSINWE